MPCPDQPLNPPEDYLTDEQLDEMEEALIDNREMMNEI